MGVYFVLFFQQLIVSGTHIIAKAIVRDIDSVTLTTLRSVISGLGLLLMFLIKEKRLKIRKEDYKKIFWLGLISVPINQFLFLYAIGYTTASNAALLYAATPMAVLIFSRILLKELITWKKVLGVATAFTGIAIVIFEKGLDFKSEFTYGNILIFIGMLSWALYTIYGKPLIMKYGALHVTAVTMIFGTILFLPLGLYSTIQFPFSSLSLVHWEGVFYLAVGTSIFGYFLWYYALGRIEASKVAIFANGQPIMTTLLAVLFLGQAVSVNFIIGGIITIAGVILTQFG